MQRDYLDNAATIFPKAEAVYLVMDEDNHRCGAAIGRGFYRATLAATQIVQSCVLFLVDTVEAAGHLPINLKTLPIDTPACLGRKELLGPSGTGSRLRH